MHLIDAVGKNPHHNYICVHHEQSSAFAADAYSRIKGVPGVCYLTAGPGGPNAITGILEAWLDSSPLICISGQSKVSQTVKHSKIKGLRQFGTFECDILPIIKSITKYQAFLTDAKNIAQVMEEAYYYATEGRPGPVFIDIPIDIQGAKVDPNHTLIDHKFKENKVDPQTNPLNFLHLSESRFDEIIELIQEAKNPVLFGGRGLKVAQLENEFIDLAETLSIPMVTTPFAVDAVPYDHHLFMGHPSLKGDRTGNFIIQKSDLIICLGNSLHVMTTGYDVASFAPKAKIILIDIDPAILERQEVRVEMKIQGSLENFFKLFNAKKNQLTTSQNNEWVTFCQGLKKQFVVTKENHPRVKKNNQDFSINYYDIIDELSEHMPKEGCLVTDAGLAYYLVGQALRVKKGQRVINSGGLGTMGFALPAAIGAWAAEQENKSLDPIICLTGDGSLQTNIQEFASIRQNNMNILCLVVNNGGYVSIRNTQNNYFEGNLVGSSKDSGVWLPNLKDIANTYKIDYERFETLNDLKENFKSIFSKTGPLICEIFTDKEAQVIPTVQSQKLSDGTMISKPFHDMYPYLDRSVILKIMEGELPNVTA